MADHRDPLLSHKNPDAHRLLDIIYKSQVDLYFPLELSIFMNDATWERSGSVLDVGTGNGCFIGQLAEWFPSKQYVGIDKQPDMISLALPLVRKGLRFDCEDLFAHENLYDVAIARLVAQHVGDLDALLKKLAGLVRLGGRCFIIDAAERSFFHRPVLPSLLEMYEAVVSQRRDVGANHRVMALTDQAISLSPHWRLACSQNLAVPSALPGNHQRYATLQLDVIHLLELTGSIDFDFDQMRKEWTEWCKSEKSYIEHRLKILTLERV